MTDDIVARLRHEQELCTVMGDTKAGALVGEAAAVIESERAMLAKLGEERVEAIMRAEAAEARVRELEAVNAALNERAAQYERLYRDAKAEAITWRWLITDAGRAALEDEK